jgi:peptidoglycan/LPS O-acetylase OafA/YrhL
LGFQTVATRNNALDGLRAVAVLLVFAVHTHQTTVPGGLGVDIFFVLSGFLITRLLVTESATVGRIDLIKFYSNRFARLMPALVAMCFVVILGYSLIQRGLPQDKTEFAGIALTYTANIYVTLTGSMIDPFSHTWSLAQEEQFYLIWPLILVLLLKKKVSISKVAWFLTGLAALSALCWFIFGSITPFNPLLKYGGLLAGSAGALFSTVKPRPYRALSNLLLLIFVSALALEAHGALSRNITSPLTNLCFVFIVLSLAYANSPIGKVLAVPPLAYLGRISYGFYLWHYPILYFASTTDLNPLVQVVSSFLATFAVAALSFHWLEQPILRRRSHIANWARKLAGTSRT